MASRREFLRYVGLLGVAGFVDACQRRTSFEPTRYPTPAAPPVSTECLAFNPEIQSAALTELNHGLPLWKSAYIIPDTHGKRVVRRENDNDTVSEGIGYGLKFCLWSDDPTNFDSLWQYAQSKFNQNGLMSWQVRSDGSAPDKNSATDADIDMASALIDASRKWPQYQKAALTLVNNIYKYDVEPATFILKPGDGWGGSDATNPSYFSPLDFEKFKSFTNNSNWDLVAAGCRQTLTNIQNQRHISSDLMPNWTTAAGQPVPKMGDQNGDFTYDAVRVAYRQSEALVGGLCRNPQTAQSALSLLKSQNAFFEKIGPDHIVDGYHLDGTPSGQYHNAPFVGAAAIASIVSTNLEYQKAVFNELKNLKPENYYNDSLRIWSLAILGGKFND